MSTADFWESMRCLGLIAAIVAVLWFAERVL